MTIYSHWIGLRENLEETIIFTYLAIKWGGGPVDLPLNQSNDYDLELVVFVGWGDQP